MLSRVIALTALCLTGCALPTRYEVMIAPEGFTAEQLEDVVTGVDSWHYADARIDAYAVIGYCFGPGGNKGCITAMSPCQLPGGHTAQTELPWHLGERFSGGTIQICTDIYHGARWALRGAAAHETGHLMGLQHTATGLMSPYPAFDIDTPQPEDLAQFWSLR